MAPRQGRSVALVVITRDQAWNVPRLLGSVLRDAQTRPEAEILVVDSASSDTTTEAAARYPVRVVRLSPDQPLTPAAGRYIGYLLTSAELVLFLDGDMELCEGWLSEALRVMEERPDAAVVTGDIIDVPPTAAGSLAARSELRPPRQIRYSGGAALHRRSVLEEVGTFNPFLHSDEEPELCIRVRQAGYTVLDLGLPIAYHYSSPSAALTTLVQRRRRGLYFGAGEAIRYHLRDGLLWPYVRERGYGLLPGLAVLMGGITAAWSVATGRWRSFHLWLLLASLVVTGDAVRKRSPYRTLHSLVLRCFILEGTIRGFLRVPLAHCAHPRRFEVVSECAPRRPASGADDSPTDSYQT